MQREIKNTADGSKTLYIKDLEEGYHSHHGALQEAQHVFIKNGINNIKNSEINILELGFGTGLNALVTLEYLKNSEQKLQINYFSLEKYPVKMNEVDNLAFHQLFNDSDFEAWNTKIHECTWESPQSITPQFNLTKFNTDFFNLTQVDLPPIDLVYFDCFGARVQPELWELPLAEMIAHKMKSGGLLTTYSSKGSFQRVLKSLNFEVKKVEGPKGKREMINAWKH